MTTSTEYANKIIIHFGMHKTGTTSIQMSLYKNFLDKNFHYVNLGKANPSNLLIAAFKRNPVRNIFFRKNGINVEEIVKIGNKTKLLLKRELTYALNNEKIPIICCENISLFDQEELLEFVTFIKSYYSNLQFYGYIRSPKGFIDSILQQNIKTSMKVNFNVLNRKYPRFRRRFDFYDNLDSSVKVHFRKFDPTKFPQGCVVRDFCMQIGVDISKVRIRNANEGLSLPAIQLLYAYKKFGPGHGVGNAAVRENNALNRAVSALEGPKLRLHSELIEPIIAANRKDVAWMEGRLGESLQEDLRAHDSDAIRSEADLLTFRPEAISWLREQLASKFAPTHNGIISPKEAADYMHLLRLKLAAR